VRIERFGIPNDSPIVGDFDGDGKFDLAVRRGATWFMKESSSGITRDVVWQQAWDMAVPGDYDADGKTDVAVWRNSNGTWYIRNSSSPNAVKEQQWGQSGDIPVPASYRR
jgi:spore coat protein A, manganese oxidase